MQPTGTLVLYAAKEAHTRGRSRRAASQHLLETQRRPRAGTSGVSRHRREQHTIKGSLSQPAGGRIPRNDARSMPRTVIRRPWWPLLPLLALGAEDPAPSKLSFFGSAKEAEPAAPSKLSFFGSASAGDARRQEDGQDSKRAAAAAADAPKRPFFGSSSAKQAREQEEPVLSDLQPEAEQEDEEVRQRQRKQEDEPNMNPT